MQECDDSSIPNIVNKIVQIDRSFDDFHGDTYVTESVNLLSTKMDVTKDDTIDRDIYGVKEINFDLRSTKV